MLHKVVTTLLNNTTYPYQVIYPFFLVSATNIHLQELQLFERLQLKHYTEAV